MANQSKIDSLTPDMAALFANPKYSDLEIQCHGKVFSVHRAIVCARSKEAGERIVKHEMFDSATMSRMLHFMYEDMYATDAETITMAKSEDTELNPAPTTTDDYIEGEMATSVIASKTVDRSTEKESSMNFEVALAHVNVYLIADFYDVPDLKGLALRNFDELNCPIEPEIFTIVLTTIYTHTFKRDDPLRQMVANQATLRLSSLLQCEPFTRALAETHELQTLAADLLPRVYRQVMDRTEESATLKADLTKSKSETSTAEQMFKDSESAKDKQYSEFDDLTSLIFNRSACRHCRKEFGSYVDTIPRSGGSAYIVRCRQCLCRHFD
nr:hypothetical protein CFP56_23833 [Quercus suber]